MAFTWIPFYKELAYKLLEYKDKRDELVRIVYGLDNEYVVFLRESKTKKEFSDIHPFAVFAIFSRLVILEKKQAILKYFKEKFNLQADIPSDFDGIPSINPQKSFWGLNWFEDDSEIIKQNWELFEIAAADELDEERFIKAFNLVIQQNGAKWNVTQALFRAFPYKFLSLDENSRNYLTKNGIAVMKEKDFNGKSFIEFSKLIKEKLDSNELKDGDFVKLSHNSWLSGNEAVNYWLIAPGENAWDWDAQKKEGIIAIGWHEVGDVSQYKNDFQSFYNHFQETYNNSENDKTVSAKQVWNFYKEIKIGDIVFARKGVHKIIGIGKVVSDFIFNESRGENPNIRKVEWQKIDEWEYPGQSTRNTVHKLKLEQAMEILKTMDEQEKGKTISIINLLESSKNLILHGAPGTGKTYMAKEIAKEMGADVGFVQFHPSYDYTDFVEGLRPAKNENDTTVTFEKTDGIFKQFCEKALLSASVKGGTDNFEEAYSLLLEKIEKENYVEVETMTKSSKFKVELNEYENGLTTRTYPNDEYKKGEWLPGHSRFYTKEQLYNIYRGLPGVPKGGHDNYRKAIIKYMKDNLQLKDYVPGTTEKQDKKFVFIIDEINRGELSKIFGELFYSIDPGYRIDISQLDRENLPVTIKTQYSNMQNEPNEFDIVIGEQEDFGHFFIPDNVYIIGTMNDIDRSVESMDFAFRRRFTFKEITAKDTQEAILSELEDSIREEAVKRMDSLNNAIDGIDGLSSAYHIGGAYFLKLKDLENSYENLWEYHLSGLLREYLRGMEDAEELLEDLHDAYNLKNQE